MKRIFKKLKEWFAIRKANRELDNAIVLAERLFRATNKRHYVIPNYKHQLSVYTYASLKQMKKQGMFSSNVKESDFIKESFYYTPADKNCLHMKPETKDKKRKMWIEYYKAYRM